MFNTQWDQKRPREDPEHRPDVRGGSIPSRDNSNWLSWKGNSLTWNSLIDGGAIADWGHGRILGLEQCHQFLSNFYFCSVGYNSDRLCPHIFPGSSPIEKREIIFQVSPGQDLDFTLIGTTWVTCSSFKQSFGQKGRDRQLGEGLRFSNYWRKKDG